MASCGERENNAAAEKIAPEFMLSIDGTTRAAHNYSIEDYFGLGEGFQYISITDDPAEAYIYVYNQGSNRFSPKDSQNAIYFPTDGSALEGLTFMWPTDDFVSGHVAEYGGFKVLKDQSARKDFLSMDWLVGQIRNVKPTMIIPVMMYHTFNAKITVALEGQYEGKRIESLTIGDFKAYCDPALKTAQLMYGMDDIGSLPPGSSGSVKIEGVEAPYYFVITDSPDDFITEGGQNFTIFLNL